jgi:hypothetical protein
MVVDGCVDQFIFQRLSVPQFEALEPGKPGRPSYKSTRLN